jgi:hypothetical protein
MLLLFLGVYIFAIVAFYMLKDNDPVRFGNVLMSCVTLLQVTPLLNKNLNK